MQNLQSMKNIDFINGGKDEYNAASNKLREGKKK